jgi:aerobic carbon-monoxide dehydrogenase small subunit
MTQSPVSTNGAPTAVAVTLTVNGQPREAVVEPRRTLADLLREGLGLTGTHLGCEHGVCGACTVILDGEPVRSCLVLAVQARGGNVTTVEGLASGPGPDQLHPVQQACLECLSFQCGFCTPGFLMSAVAYLQDRHAAGAGVPSDHEVREAMSGNLCRCTGYQTIIEGIRLAAERTIGGNPSAQPAHATGDH